MNKIDETFWEDYEHLKREVIILRESEVRLNEIRSRYRAMLSSKAVLIAVLDKNGIFKEINPYGLELLGLEEKSVVNKPVIDIFMDMDSSIISDHAKSVIKHSSGINFVWTLSQMYGPPIKLRVHIEPVKDSTDHVDSALAVAYDISENDKLKYDLLELQESNNKIQKLLDKLNDKQ